MAWGKGKTEKGQGGKLGHSNRDGWGFHDEEKLASRKQRRLDQKQLILTESSKIENDLLDQANVLLQIISERNIKFEYEEFDSGAVMLDIWINNVMYCIQMADNRFGWSIINNEIGFCTIPDSGYLDWNTFKPQFDKIIN